MKTAFLVSLVALIATGCASVAVKDDNLVKNTAMTLGLSADAFKISNRVDEGIKTTYLVTTTSGKTYGCYVTGAVTLTGRNVSDAVCTEQGRPSAAAAAPAPAATPCNALLKAAGKCS